AGKGCLVIQADELGREVMAPGGEAYEGVVKEFGPEILANDGTIDRRKLAARVFGNSDRLARLNALVHPAVIRLEEEPVADFERREPKGIAVVEAAILIETGSYKRFDKMILVTCGQDQQIARAMRRTGAAEADVRARLDSQMTVDEKRKFADFVI